LLVLAEELGQLVEAVGGAEQAHHLLTPLENIAAVEDAAVRDKVSVTLRIETCLTCYILGI
jgi:serine/threonine-protein phosphatase 2A regulatory subunit A